MTQEHPITPPPELVNKIFGDALRGSNGQHDYELRLIHAAYAAGADQELEACKQAIVDQDWFAVPKHRLVELHNVRRPKPSSLKAQALAELEEIMDELHEATGSGFTASALRRALEALDD